MIAFILSLAVTSIAHANQPLTAKQVQQSDPNGYFQKREWTLNVNASSKLHVVSEYKGEPIQNPNSLTAYLICPKNKKVVAVENFKYCGIDSVSITGGNLELYVVDFNPTDPKGYCSKNKRVQSFKIPSCSRR